MMRGPYSLDDQVLVRNATPPGHIRTPMFLRGQKGRVVDILGPFANPEELAYGRSGTALTLYRVQFQQVDVWQNYDGDAGDTIIADLYENWLEPA